MGNHIRTKHKVVEFEAREAFQAPARLREAGWDWCEEHGCWRLLVIGTTYSGRVLRGSLFPARPYRDRAHVPLDDNTETWWLGTAWSAP